MQKNADISKIKRALVLKSIFSETQYVCVLMCQIWSFWHDSNEFRTGVILQPTTSKRTPKKLTQIKVKDYIDDANRKLNSFMTEAVII